MARLWRNIHGTLEGKYLVQRRDGTIPQWPYFVLGAADPAAPRAIIEYAKKCRGLGMDEQYVNDLLDLAIEFDKWRLQNGTGDPDASKHRKDDPEIIEKMRTAQGS
jgi:hypothetical protein